MIELLIRTGESIFINIDTVSTELVKRRVRDMRYSDFEYVLKGLHNNTTSIHNMQAYIQPLSIAPQP